MKVLVIIPCYNEEKNILNVVKEIKKYKYDYVVINDGSSDKSLEILKKNKLNYINLHNNVGIGAAMQTGYKYAYDNDYDIAVQFDGDGQHNASYIKRIIEPIEESNVNMVIGSRFVGKESEFKSTKTRQLGIKILSLLLKKMTKSEIKDMTSGFRAVDKDIIKFFAKSYPYEYPEPVTNFYLSIKNYNIKEVSVSMRERMHGKSSISSLKSIYYMFNVILLFILIYFSKGDDFNA